MPDVPTDDDAPEEKPAGKPVLCPACGARMRFEGGTSTHDLYAEKFVCPECGRVEYRSYGRGSV